MSQKQAQISNANDSRDLETMKKRNKKLRITIDSLPSGLDNGSIMNRSASSVKSIANFIGISNLGFRRRKNFSLILLAGLSALLCALYYTSYYPYTVWTFRLGISSFNTTYNGQEKRDASRTSFSASASGIRNSHSHNNLEAAAGLDLQAEIFPSVFEGSSRGDENRISGEEGDANDIITNSHKTFHMSTISGGGVGSSRHYNQNNNNPNREKEEEAEHGGNLDDITTPKTWSWKYWTSLGYWKVNMTGDSFNDEAVSNEEITYHPSLSKKFAAASEPSIIARTMMKVKVLPRSNRLACNFPRLKPFDPSITEFIKGPPDIDCTKDYPLVFRSNFRNKLILWRHPFLSRTKTGNENEGIRNDNVTQNYSCCYKTVTRGNGSDHNIIYSKRCFPIVKAETDIPADHEFISLRCRSIVGHPHETSSHHKGNQGPPERETHKDGNNGINSSNNNDNTITSTKVYKDMMAFVPLKPMVEDRIRKYEESKRKFHYAQSKVKSNKNINILEEDTNKVKGATRQKISRIIQKQKLGITLSGEDGPDYKNYSEVSSSSSIPHFTMHFERNEKDEHQSQAKTTSTNEDRLSVVILGLDAQSHMNFIRQMPQTYNFLTKNLSAIGMLGYTKVGDNTFPNVVTLLSGLSVEELEKVCWPTKQSYFDSCPFIWKKFAGSGYRTSLAEDSVWMGTFNYEKKGFLHSPTDYYLHPMSLLMAKKIGHETWANAKLCYGPRLAFEVLLDYIVKTAATFRNSLYFQFVWANSLFHDYLNNPRLGDELLMMTLEFLKNNGFLENTALVLLSDHGIRWGSIRSTYQGKIEERMPLAYFTFPSWFRQKYPLAMRNLRKNVLRLTTPFDVYETLIDILHISQGKSIRYDRWCDDDVGSDDNKGDCGRRSKSDSVKEGVSGYPNKYDGKPPRGISLFRPVPFERTCEMAGIEEHWCVCHKMEKVPINSTLVRSGAQFVLDIINGLARKHSGLCANLSLLKINEAKRKIDGDIDRGLDVDFFLTRETGTSTTTPVSSIGTNPIWRTSGDNYHIHRSTSILDSSTSKSDDFIQRKRKSDESSAAKKKTEEALKEKDGQIKSRGSVKTVIASEVSKIEKGSMNVMGSLSSSSDIKKMIQLQITLVTQPGEAVFEATIYGEADTVLTSENETNQGEEENINHQNHHWKLSGDISRLNMYGTQSACITDYKVQKYCYCQNLKME